MNAFREYLEAVLVAILLALFAKAFVFEAFEIPSPSMTPTLLVGDVVLVNKFVYAPHAGPWRSWLPYREPAEGDVFVFRSPERPELDFVKRVAGAPGARVEIRGNVLRRDGAVVPEPWRDGGSAGGPALRPDWGPVTVPEDRWVALGDNRDNSRDSRFWGLVPGALLRGRAVSVLWSWDATGAPALDGRGARLRRWLEGAIHFRARVRSGRILKTVR